MSLGMYELAPFWKVLFEELGFKKTEKRIEQICYHKTDNNGTEDAKHPGKPNVERIKSGYQYDQKKQKGTRNDADQPIIPFVGFH